MSNARSPRFDCSTTIGTSVLLKTSTDLSSSHGSSIRAGDAGPIRSAGAPFRRCTALRPCDEPSRALVARSCLLRDRLLDHLHLVRIVIDDLLLEEGPRISAQRLRILLVEFPDLLFLAGILADPARRGLGDLVRRRS
jgi:hypothetical protein